MRESALEKYLDKRVKEVGGVTRKIAYIGRRGCPDRLVLLPRLQYDTGGFQPWGDPVFFTDPPKQIFVELKRPDIDKADAHQAREHELLRSFGVQVVVINSVEQIEELLR